MNAGGFSPFGNTKVGCRNEAAKFCDLTVVRFCCFCNFFFTYFLQRFGYQIERLIYKTS